MRGGVFVSCRDFPGMSFSCGTQLSTDCEREGPTAPWVGSLSPIEAFLVCPFSVGSSSQVSVRGRGMPHLHLGWGWLSFSNIYTKKMLQPPILKPSHSSSSEAEIGRFRLRTDVCQTFIKQLVPALCAVWHGTLLLYQHRLHQVLLFLSFLFIVSPHAYLFKKFGCHIISAAY